LVQRRFTVDRQQTLWRHRGCFWHRDGSYYTSLDGEPVRAAVWNFLDNARRHVKSDDPKKKGLTEPLKPKRANVGELVDALGVAMQA
jgi:hypothetical protein